MLVVKKLAAVLLAAVALVIVGRPAVVSTATDPALVGQWSTPIPWPHVAVHAHLLKTGDVLTWQYGSTATVWNPGSGFSTAANPFTDLLCAGHTFLSDGRMMAIGGWSRSGGGLGVTDISLFNPATAAWAKVAPMAFRRWYATGTILPDGRVLVTSGDINTLNDIATTPEIYDPTTNQWTSLVAATNPLPVYPFMFVLPDGRILSAGTSEVATPTIALDLTTQKWTTVDPVTVDGGSAVMFAPGKILKAGTAADSGNTGSAAKTAYVLDMTRAAPSWKATGSMAFARSFLNLTALPDGTVLATGGGTDRSSFNTGNAIHEAEIWSAPTGVWTTMAAMQTPRLYHSIALLLPDARVLVAGGGSDAGVADQMTAEIFSPPYLFKGPRPTISNPPSTFAYGATSFVGTPDATGIASVTLIGTGSVTHFFNTHQRTVALDFTVTQGGLNITAPSSPSSAPPGDYLLFIVNGAGVPSVAASINLPAPGTLPPSPPPTGLVAASGAAAVTLAWAPPSGGPAVVRYNVYRSTLAGFALSSDNLIGQSTTAGFADSGLLAATYFYRVTAVDGLGRVSAPSNEASATVQPSQNGGPVAVDKVVFSDGVGQRITSAFSTTTAAELLLAFVGSDGPSGQTVAVSGGGLVWTLVRRINAQPGTSEVWRANAPNILTNVTVTATQATGNYYQSLTVVAFSGAAGIGATGGASAATGAPTVSLTPTATGSLVYGVGNDWDRATARTAATGQVIVHQYLASAGDTFWVQHLGAPVLTAGAAVQLNDSAPTTDRWNFVAVEIVPSGPPPARVVVPDVRNLSQSDASAALTAARLTVGAVTGVPSATVPPGFVISETPAAGIEVAPGTAIALAVSSGPPPVVVPNVIGADETSAASIIQAAGLTVGATSTQPSATTPPGAVISQLPLAGALAAPGSAVAIVVSNGPPPPVIVPTLLNLTQAAATAAITSAGLSLGTITTAPSTVVSAGLVLLQDPAGASAVPAGTRVNLTLSSGPPPVEVPNIVGQTQDAALAAIATANLTRGSISTAPNAVIAAGLVSGQTPIAGALVAVGTQVSFVVSSGAPSSPSIDKVIFSDGSGTRTTAAFSTTSANEVLLAFVASDGPSAGGQTSTVSGAGVTWTLVKRVNTQPGTSEIWRASASTLLSNVTVKSTPSKSGYAQSLTVVTFADATGVGASSVASAAAGAPTVSLTTTKPGSRVFAVGNDWDRATTRTPATGQAIVHESLVTVGDTFWVQQIVNAVTSAGSVVQVADVGPTTDRWNLACVEIVR